MKRRLAIMIVALAAAAPLTAALLGGTPANGAARSQAPPATCSRAYGQCQVTEYIHVRRDGTQWIETCFAALPVTEGHGNVRVAVDYCYRP